MSFILQFFTAQQVDSVKSAVAYIDSGGANRVAPAKQFEKFVALVTAVYPDRSEEDEDGDSEANLWPEGLDARWGHAPVVNVAIKTEAVEEAVLSIIATKAVEAGLQMLDPQNAMLYRSDGSVVDAHGRTRPFATPMSPAAKSARSVDGAFTPRHVREGIGTRLRDHLSGSQACEMKTTDSLALVFRQHGDIRHVISIAATGGSGRVDGYMELWLSSDKLSSVWVGALPVEVAAWKAKSDAACGGVAYDFAYGLSDIVPAATADEAERFAGRFTLCSHAELNDFITQLCGFVADKLMPVLDAVKDLPSLATLALTDESIEIARSGRVRLAEQMSTVVLTRLARPSAFEDIAQALRGNRNKGAYWRELNDPEGRLLDRLIERLRAMPTA